MLSGNFPGLGIFLVKNVLRRLSERNCRGENCPGGNCLRWSFSGHGKQLVSFVLTPSYQMESSTPSLSLVNINIILKFLFDLHRSYN